MIPLYKGYARILLLVDSKRWELATSKENSQDQPSLPKAYTVVIEQSIKNL